MPEDIGPARWINKTLGLCMLGVAAFTGWPVGFGIYYDGLASVVDWPALFNWLSAITALSLGLGSYLLIMPQRVGGEICFHENGLTVRIRAFFRQNEEHRMAWSDIREVEFVSAARNSDGMRIRLKNGTEVSSELRYFQFGVATILARLKISAELAGYRLERIGGFNALVIEKQIWGVSSVR